jgi:hypothetical protein
MTDAMLRFKASSSVMLEYRHDLHAHFILGRFRTELYSGLIMLESCEVSRLTCATTRCPVMLKQSSGLLPKEHQTLAPPGEWLERSLSTRAPAIEAKTTHRNSGLETPREQGDDMRNWVLTGCATLLAAVLTACPTTTATKPDITAFTASPTSVNGAADVVNLAWTVTGATDIKVSSDNAAATITLATGTNPTTATAKGMIIDTTFTVTATNATGASTKTAKVTVNAPTGVAPTISSSVPTNAAPSVAIANNTIVVTFDKAMNKAATEGALTGLTSPSFVWSNSDKTATITFTPPAAPTPTAAGASNTITYNFSNAAKSADGGTLAAVSRTYITKKLVLLSIPATAGVPATSLSGSLIFTTGTGEFTTVPPCITPCPRNYYDAEIRAGDNGPTVNSQVSNANFAHKGFVGFDITGVPTAVTAADVVSAKVTMTQLPPVGQPYTIGALKLQAITGVNLKTIVIDTTTDTKYAFYTETATATFDLATGFAAATPIATVTVTSALQADVTGRTARGNRSLYRLIFPRATPPLPADEDQAPGATDGDNGEDLAVFDNTAGNLPKLEIVYTQ